jgi:hypothetical protein
VQVAGVPDLVTDLKQLQDHLLRLEALGDLPREAADRRQGNVRRRVAVRLYVRDRGRVRFLAMAAF